MPRNVLFWDQLEHGLKQLTIALLLLVIYLAFLGPHLEFQSETVAAEDWAKEYGAEVLAEPERLFEAKCGDLRDLAWAEYMIGGHYTGSCVAF